MAVKSQSSISGPGAPSVVGPGGFAIGGVGTRTPNSPFKFFTPLTNNTLSPVPILGWDNDGDYQLPNDYNNALFMINVTECSLGDNPELPPPAGPATDTILMGWQGYYASKSRMLEYDDRTTIPIITTTVPVMDWTPELDNQKSNDYNLAYGMLNLVEYSLGDNPEDINYGQGTLTGWDNDADMQLSNALDYSIRLDPDDRVIRIFIPTQEIDNDAEQQLSNAVDVSRMQDPDDRTLRILIPIQELDNDGEQQFSNDTNVSSWQDPEDRTILVIVPKQEIDSDQEQQFSTDANVANLQDPDDRGVRIITPTFEIDDPAEQQLSNERVTANLGSDAGEWTQFIVVQVFNPATVPQTDDIQIADFSQYQLVEDDRGLRVILPFNDWTLDAESQLLQQGNYYTDHLADETVEKITLNPAILRMFGFDTDAEQQLSNDVNTASYQETDDRQVLVPKPPGAARDVLMMGWKGYKIPASAMTELDRGVEIIITPPPAAPTMSSHDIDQYGMLSNQVQFTSDDEGNVETTNFIILVPFVNIVEGLGEAEDE